MRAFLWLQSPLFTSNVLPTALSDRLLLKCQSTLKIFWAAASQRGGTFSDYRQVRRTQTQTEASSSSSERCFEGKSVESRSLINIPIPYAEVAKTTRSYDPILSVSRLQRDRGGAGSVSQRRNCGTLGRLGL